jgi:hypothetical protein
MTTGDDVQCGRCAADIGAYMPYKRARGDRFVDGRVIAGDEACRCHEIHSRFIPNSLTKKMDL